MYTFKKEERLCNLKLIEQLYHNGSSFLCYPFKVNWLTVENTLPYPVQVVFSVSKKRYKKAVDRNSVKRRMREAYRLHKQQFLYTPLAHQHKSMVLSIGYIGKEIVPYDVFEKKMIRLMIQISELNQK